MKRFINLINAMPTQEQAFTSKRKTWNKFIVENNEVSELLIAMFEENGNIELSRKDLFEYSQESCLKMFVIATIVWGYPAGMRGNNFSNISINLKELVQVLKEAQYGIENWIEHYKKVEPIKGLGLSTYTKLLYFLDVKVEGESALILDNRIVNIIEKGLFPELDAINTDNAVHNYPNYLKEMDKISKSYKVDSDKLEMFLFEFGLNLKLVNAD
ncbi:hypothetical protein RGQ13_01720 [Thalassotalea psychrophila]|uniref:Uncharacterized protein n=1 Tax=Thalassotalea psychrophila TaxID=3065647 RepID=A0ABY9TY55_9GAMM|nr:hypothetical protein RGQ13_01720 [Colwelliaceae bacterium SQ149]